MRGEAIRARRAPSLLAVGLNVVMDSLGTASSQMASALSQSHTKRTFDQPVDCRDHFSYS
jgi:hypothetical protein